MVSTVEHAFYSFTNMIFFPLLNLVTKRYIYSLFSQGDLVQAFYLSHDLINCIWMHYVLMMDIDQTDSQMTISLKRTPKYVPQLMQMDHFYEWQL